MQDHSVIERLSMQTATLQLAVADTFYTRAVLQYGATVTAGTAAAGRQLGQACCLFIAQRLPHAAPEQIMPALPATA